MRPPAPIDYGNVNLVPGQPTYIYGSQYPRRSKRNPSAFSTPADNDPGDAPRIRPKLWQRLNSIWRLAEYPPDRSLEPQVSRRSLQFSESSQLRVRRPLPNRHHVWTSDANAQPKFGHACGCNTNGRSALHAVRIATRVFSRSAVNRALKLANESRSSIGLCSVEESQDELATPFRMNTEIRFSGSRGALALLLLILATPCSAVDRSFTVWDSISMARFNDPYTREPEARAKISPDGRHFAVVTSRGLHSNK